MEKLKIYLAGGMASNWQSYVINELADTFIVFNPIDHLLNSPIEYTNWDLFFVNKSDILFAYMEKDNPSGIGLSLEVGFAKALGKTVILIDEKSKNDSEFEKKFAIVRESATIVFNDLDNGLKYLKTFNRYAISNTLGFS